MTPAEQQKLITFVIENQFIPQVMVSLSDFLQEYRKRVEFEVQYEMITGHKVVVQGLKPLTLDITPATHAFIGNMLIAHAQPKI